MLGTRRICQHHTPSSRELNEARGIMSCEGVASLVCVWERRRHAVQVAVCNVRLEARVQRAIADASRYPRIHHQYSITGASRATWQSQMKSGFQVNALTITPRSFCLGAETVAAYLALQ